MRILGLFLLLVGTVNAQTWTATPSYVNNQFTSTNTIQVTSGDLRGLGYSDLVLAVPPQVCVLLNNSDGTFGAPNCFGNIPGLAGIALANLNNKNIPDIVAIGSQTFVYFPGNGDGTFQAAISQSGYSLVGTLSGPVVGDFSPQGLNDNSGIGVMLVGGNCGGETSNYSYPIQPGNSTSALIVFQDGVPGPGTNNGLDSFPDCGGVLAGVIHNSQPPDQAVIRNPGADYLYSNPATGFIPYSLCLDTYDSVINGSNIISYLPGGQFCVQSLPAQPIVNGQFSVPPGEILLQVLPIILSDGTPALAGLTNQIQFFYGNYSGSGIFAPILNNPTLMQAGVFLPGGPGQDIVVLDQNGLKVFFKNPASTVPVIQTQPVDETVTLGQTATFSVTTTGNPTPDFSWTENNVVIPSATSASYSKVTVASDESATFICTVSNVNGQIVSMPATLTLNYPPTITTQPLSQTIALGSPVTFSVVADSQSTGALSYQWSHDSNSIAGATSASYTFTPTLSDSGSTFTVTVTNTYGDVVSSAAVLTVSAAPVITQEPASQSILLGSTVTFQVAVTGTTPFNFVWTQNGNVVGTNSSSYTTTAQASNNGAVFVCTVKNATGTAVSTGATLTVQFPPAITSQPTAQTVLLGSTASYSVVATGTGITYQWQRSGVNIPGATASTYRTPPTVVADNGATFDCVISGVNNLTVTTAVITLTVDIPPMIQSVMPASASVQTSIGNTVSFQITGIGTNNNFQWYKNSTAIPSATSSAYTTPLLQSSDLGDTFYCVVSNSFGKAQTQTWSLVIVLAPTIFFSEPSVSAVLESALTISAVGYVAPVGTTVTWSWAANGVAIPNATATVTTSVSNNGYITAAVAFAAVQQNQNGVVYTCTFVDAAGSVTSSGTTLTVTGNGPPPPPEYTLALAPASQTVSAGSTATFTLAVTANNSSPVSFTCSDPIPNSTCSFSPAVVDGSAQIVMSVTTGTSAFVILGWIAFILVGFTLLFTHPKFKRVKLVYASLFLAGCAGGNSSVTTPPPPTAKTYTITVTGLQNAMQQTATATLTVN